MELTRSILTHIENSYLLRLHREKIYEQEKDVQRAKTLDFAGKLADCTIKNPEFSELYIVEGNSAGGSAKSARNREFQAILPIKGKLINVQKRSNVFKNEEIKSIITAIGCSYGESFDISKRGYNKIILMTDADVDGSHIRVLLLTFLYKYMPELIRQGHVYIAQPPLFKASSKKDTIYLFDEKEKSEFEKKHVINSRALPDLRDGLKPVHRRILYSAYEEKMFNDSRFKKSAALVGSVMGSYHPHGDSSIYGALVRMCQDFSMRYPLLEGQGNFGSIDGDPPAAMRYTEVKMSKMGERFLEGIRENCVDFRSNYDGSKQEPSILPISLPSILLNGGDGIAVGMASKIPSHNLKEVCEAVIALIDNPKMEDSEFLSIIQGPDFPTGGEILRYDGIKDYFLLDREKKRRFSFIIRAKVELNYEKRQIIVKEIPFGVKKGNLIKQIARLASNEKNPKYKVIELLRDSVTDIRDESNLKEGIRLVIECRKGIDLNVVLSNLYKYSALQIPYAPNLTLLIKGEPKTITVGEVLRNYIAFQLEKIERRTEFNLHQLENRIHLLDGRKKAVEDVDEVIRILREEEDPEDILKDKYELSEIQVKDIVDLRLKSLKKIEIQKLIEELEEKIESKKKHEEILGDEKKRYEIIRKNMEQAIADYPEDSRRTHINREGSGRIRKLDLIQKEELVVGVTKDKYIFAFLLEKVKLHKNRGGIGIKLAEPPNNDIIIDILVTSSYDDLFIFTDAGKVYRIKAHEISVNHEAQ
ncbi:hypothetical protein PVNG_02368 [Plasmodium vivax North Korean]|uniref:Uncharacterized protein n=1 Tax=Plasmodium vivax North Korean TaxID=1035514 RepID=A0A0J9TKH8_PLAVI|nr:hypothetical protein PVNG_02368 [Plasmodium vivax North Korean]